MGAAREAREVKVPAGVHEVASARPAGTTEATCRTCKAAGAALDLAFKRRGSKRVRHHFGDELDREGGYWTIIPNRERYAHRIGDVPEGSADVAVATIGKDDVHWRRVLTLPNLEELTLHEPSHEQMAAASTLQALKRLRITHARPKTLDFISSLVGVEELVLEYVSGFSDLSPLRALTRLRALHMENLRRVSDFSGISGLNSLRYLAVQGTLDWKQPFDDFEFLRDLPNLEVLKLFQMITKAPYPAMLPALGLKRLKRINIPWTYLAIEEYALLEAGLRGVEGSAWGAYRRFQRAPDSHWFEFTGKGERGVACDSPTADEKCRRQTARYEALIESARALIDRHKT